jgi:replicative DNA helicase
MEVNLNDFAKIEIEKAVIGMVLLESHSMLNIDYLRGEHFYFFETRNVFEIILQLQKESQPINYLTVIKQDKNLIPYEISKLTQNLASTREIEYFAKMLIDLFAKRELLKLANSIQRDLSNDLDLLDIIADKQKIMADLTDYDIRKGNHIKFVVSEFNKTLLFETKRILTKYEKLDSLLTISPSDLIILAARPSMGKTAFALNLCLALAKQNIPVGFFSLEMSEFQLLKRLESINSQIDSNVFKCENFTDLQLNSIYNSGKELSELPIYIDDTSGLSEYQIKTKTQKLFQTYHVRIIIIDYLQLMTCSEKKPGNREQEISVISRRLKALAKELDIPVIALSQLNRGLENRADKRPNLSDLRESGSIEQDADAVLFLYRPEVYDGKDELGDLVEKGLTEVICKKQRAGDIFTTEMYFNGKFQKFTETQILNEKDSFYQIGEDFEFQNNVNF